MYWSSLMYKSPSATSL